MSMPFIAWLFYVVFCRGSESSSGRRQGTPDRSIPGLNLSQVTLTSLIKEISLVVLFPYLQVPVRAIRRIMSQHHVSAANIRVPGKNK